MLPRFAGPHRGTANQSPRQALGNRLCGQIPRIFAFEAANSSSVRMPWSLRAASCLICSTCGLSAASGAAGSSAGAGAGGAWSWYWSWYWSWSAAALRCADFAPMWAAVPATTAVVAMRAMGRRRRNGMSIASCCVGAFGAGPFGANSAGLSISAEGFGQGAHGLFDDLARDSCALEDDSVRIAHCFRARARPGVLPDDQHGRGVRFDAQTGVAPVSPGENPPHLGVEAGDRRQFLDSVVLDYLHTAGGVFHDEGEVDDPDQSAVDELGQLRHDLPGELVAREAENDIFHRTEAHGLSPVWPRHPRSVRPQVSTNDEQGLSPPEDDSAGRRHLRGYLT